ncbi:hypothetical protein PaG_04466 [Moesziomyces aphidis]|uniref:RING-type domain-containing protein n=1 Tax=Moesziomyces aphidis TaxID=84754 RepID=W3VIS3_MOEAP|nr:hypothetical protein PaG_04466 [Moesziomyces aphidis]
MPRSLVDTVYSGTEWFASIAAPPLRSTYDFLFPPLDLLDDTRDAAAVGRRAGSIPPPPPTYDDELDAWDSFSDSPWSFVTSRYTIALVAVAIVNNRIQHICRPRGGARTRLSQLQRVALRLPGLVLLARAVLIFATVVVDAFVAPTNPLYAALRRTTTVGWRDTWLAHKPVGGWAGERFGSSSRDALLRARDATAMWAAFTSTCVTVVSDALIRSLDADRDEPGAFNLVGFAFLLHFHSFTPDAPATEHVYLCILLQLLQLWTIALTRCRRPVYAPRLVVSGVFGVVSLVHYVAVESTTGQYPFLEVLSRAPELALVCIIALTVGLHALTMLLLEGRVQPHRLLFSRSNMPAWEEDWSLALFKLGTACMESTRLTGMEREAEPLVVWHAPYLELGRSGGIELVEPHARISAVDEVAGLAREVKEVRIETVRQSAWSFGHAGLARVQAAAQFGLATLRVVAAIVMAVAKRMARAAGVEWRVPAWALRAARGVRLVWHGTNGEARRQARQEQTQRQVQRIRPTVSPAEPVHEELDEEDTDFAASDAETESIHSATSDTVGADEISHLISEHTSSETVTESEAFNQLLLAHLTRSAAPLTRSRYTALLPRGHDDALSAALADRRAPPSGAMARDDARRLCVVCCTEERNVICWPCRCLALCMDCREHLASQPPARTRGQPHTHLCPTCRTPVQAFSRLYIP